MGERPNGTGREEEEARTRRRRALEEPIDVLYRPEAVTPRFEVRNTRHATRYWVFLPAFPNVDEGLCDCPDFGRRGIGTCKHIEAVRLWLREHPRPDRPAPSDLAPVVALWSRIESTLHERDPHTPLDPRGLRRAGEMLLRDGVDGDPGAGRRPRAPVGRAELPTV